MTGQLSKEGQWHERAQQNLQNVIGVFQHKKIMCLVMLAARPSANRRSRWLDTGLLEEFC